MPSKPAKRPARRPARKSTPPAEPPAQPLVDATVGGPVTSRPHTFLVAKDDTVLAPASLGDLDFGWLVEQLDLDPRVRVEARLIPPVFGASLGTSITDEVVVATMPEQAPEDCRSTRKSCSRKTTWSSPRRRSQPEPTPTPVWSARSAPAPRDHHLSGAGRRSPTRRSTCTAAECRSRATPMQPAR